MVKVIIPTPLRRYTGNQEALELEGTTIGEVLAQLTQYGDLKKHLYTAEGTLRNFVNVYLNDEDIRHLQKDQTPVQPSDIVSIVPSIAGGR
ncbi:MoaD/ThiS family protein [Candidatus Cyanaurora vandensis]|uniref:MoaD/ThiS family protein n=1 Tax=Candidatus Cyanaurora vandensis TaxID=2714958 RepID=UPI0025797422|nr:MoaD/ThiS family protein [Candidatus Cyanaurora vandensis]